MAAVRLGLSKPAIVIHWIGKEKPLFSKRTGWRSPPDRVEFLVRLGEQPMDQGWMPSPNTWSVGGTSST